jgi:PPOX class probable FMN-dependent enzyme
MVGYIERSPFLQLGTADSAGLPFVSPKGDEAGFVLVVNERTLAIPDRPGNSILMGLQNVLANPNVGMCFEIPGYGTTLRVGGKAEISNDPELLHRLEARGLDAMLAIVVEIDYAFFHCSKAYLRSRLWEPESWTLGKEQYQVSMSHYFANSEEDLARLDSECILLPA